jgi:hypothetical protein
MRDKDSGIVTDAIPAGGASFACAARLLKRVVHALGEFWRKTVYAQERLPDIRFPAGSAGALRWQRQPGGRWRLAGCYIPAARPSGGPGRMPGDA